METVSDFIFLGSKITADGDCSHEIKRRLILRREVTTKLDSILKSRDITLPTKVHLVKAIVFPVVRYGLWSHKPGVTEIRRTDNSNKLIVDPQSCDRGDYTAFVGYYAVTPWNNYYTSSRLAKNLVQTNQTAIIAVEALEQIQVGMTYDQVTRILGVHGRDIGSGAIIFEYNLITGETVNIYFHRDNVNDETLYVYAIDY